MKLHKPELPEQLFQEEELLSHVLTARDTDEEITAISVNICAPESDFTTLHFNGVLFDRCKLAGSDFEGASFTDVIFKSCDLSGCDFTGSYFNRCLFDGCKGIGINLSDTRIHQFTIHSGSFQYAAINHAKFTGALIENCDLSGADITECVFKELSFNETRLYGASFFRTALKGLDLTSCQIEAIRVSQDGSELRGVTVDVYQAAEFAKLMGVLIK